MSYLVRRELKPQSQNAASSKYKDDDIRILFFEIDNTKKLKEFYGFDVHTKLRPMLSTYSDYAKLSALASSKFNAHAAILAVSDDQRYRSPLIKKYGTEVFNWPEDAIKKCAEENCKAFVAMLNEILLTLPNQKYHDLEAELANKQFDIVKVEGYGIRWTDVLVKIKYKNVVSQQKATKLLNEKLNRKFEYEKISVSDLHQLSKQQFEQQLENFQIKSRWNEFERSKLSEAFPIDFDKLFIQTCKSEQTSSSGQAFIVVNLNREKTYYKADISFNQLLTFLLKTDFDKYDVRLLMNLYGNDKPKTSIQESIENLPTDIRKTTIDFFTLQQKFDDGTYEKLIARKQYDRATQSKIEGYHFFVTHKERAKKIRSYLESCNYDIGNVIGYQAADNKTGASNTSKGRFNSDSVMTDKNLYIIFSDNLTDIDKKLVGANKIHDMFFLCACQLINKYSRLDKINSPFEKDEIPRFLLEKAISDEKIGLAIA